jgi:hypothetical protein
MFLAYIRLIFRGSFVEITTAILLVYVYIQGIHKRMVRFQFPIQLKQHHSFVYALCIWY